MHKRYPCGGIGRRQFLAGAASLPVLAGLHASAQEPKAARDPKAIEGKLGVPGPYPGRVIEARNPAMIRDGVKDRAAIRQDARPGPEEPHRLGRRGRGLADVLRGRATWSGSR